MISSDEFDLAAASARKAQRRQVSESDTHVLTADALAAAIGISRSHVGDLTRERKIPSIKPGRRRLYNLPDVLKALEDAEFKRRLQAV